MTTRRAPATGRTAAQASRAFYADPAMRYAAEALRHGHGYPTRLLGAVPGPRLSRQMRAVTAGRPARALPTRTMRAVKRRARRAYRRATLAGSVLGVALLVLVFLIPLVAAVTAAVTLAAMTLAYSR